MTTLLLPVPAFGTGLRREMDIETRPEPFPPFRVRGLRSFLEPGMVKDKVRIRFRKDGDLRFVSHHDLMRSFERMLRRAGLPFRSTSGFNPKPRLIFALSL